MDPRDPKDPIDSHATEEAGGAPWTTGDPAGGTFAGPYQVALQLSREHLRFWVLLAALAALSSVHFLVAVSLGPVFFVLVMGGTVDRLAGTGCGIAGTWRRWRHRLGPLVGVSLVTTLVLGLWIGGVLTLSTVAASFLPGPGPARLAVLALGGLLALFGAVAQSYYLAYVHEVVIFDGEGVLASLGRSVQLVHRAGVRYAAFYLGFMTVFLLLQVTLALGGGACGALGHDGGWLAWGASKAGLIALTFVGSLVQQALTVAWVCRFLHDRAR